MDRKTFAGLHQKAEKGGAYFPRMRYVAYGGF
jgi:hypothetical protein